MRAKPLSSSSNTSLCIYPITRLILNLQRPHARTLGAYAHHSHRSYFFSGRLCLSRLAPTLHVHMGGCVPRASSGTTMDRHGAQRFPKHTHRGRSSVSIRILFAWELLKHEWYGESASTFTQLVRPMAYPWHSANAATHSGSEQQALSPTGEANQIYRLRRAAPLCSEGGLLHLCALWHKKKAHPEPSL
jgi:hypothetical protein